MGLLNDSSIEGSEFNSLLKPRSPEADFSAKHPYLYAINSVSKTRAN